MVESLETVDDRRGVVLKKKIYICRIDFGRGVALEKNEDQKKTARRVNELGIWK